MKPASILLVMCLCGCATDVPYYPYRYAPGVATYYEPGVPVSPSTGETYAPPAYTYYDYYYGPPAYYWPPTPDYFGFGLGYFAFDDGRRHPHDHDWRRFHPPPPFRDDALWVPRHGSNQLGHGFSAGAGVIPQPGIATTPTNPGLSGLPSARHGSGQMGHGLGVRGPGAIPSAGIGAAATPATPALPSARHGSSQVGRGVGAGARGLGTTPSAGIGVAATPPAPALPSASHGSSQVGRGVDAGGRGGFSAGTTDQR
jgi:hypothetical protein